MLTKNHLPTIGSPFTAHFGGIQVAGVHTAVNVGTPPGSVEGVLGVWSRARRIDELNRSRQRGVGHGHNIFTISAIAFAADITAFF